MADVQEILNRVYDITVPQLKTEAIGAASGNVSYGRDIQEIFNAVFDSSTNTLRIVE